MAGMNRHKHEWTWNGETPEQGERCRFCGFVRDCQHPSITQEQMQKGHDDAYRYWDSSLHSHKCPDCNAWLFPDFDYETETWVLHDEPRGAGESVNV